MKLAHWVSLPDAKGKSGLASSTSELIEAEMELLGPGNVVVCGPNPKTKKGGMVQKLRTRSVKLAPWDSVLNDPDTVHVVHTYSPYTLHDMKRKIVLTHGNAEYCWWNVIYDVAPPAWWQIVALVRLCDAVVTWHDFDAQFWQEIARGEVHSIRRGVDLNYWSPQGEKHVADVHPNLFYADAMRMRKQPFALLFAAKKIQRQLKYAHLTMIMSMPEKNIAWTNLITQLEIDHFCPLVFGLLQDPRPRFRGADILISPLKGGLISRTAVETMACGTPIIAFKGAADNNPIYGRRVDDSPEGIAAGVFSLWDEIQSDPQGASNKARGLAVREWDIKDTVKSIIKACESVM